MSETKGTPDGEHIEELLSQLKGIFGHLSDSEKEEVKQKITPPPGPPRPTAPPPTPPPKSESEPSVTPTFEPPIS